jgi:hypothetical protein
MGPDPGREPPRDRSEQRALTVLERSARSGLGMLWWRITFQVLVVWGARLAISAGLVACLGAVAVMWATLSTHIAVALGAEIVLTAGALLSAHGMRLWWAWRGVRGGPGRGGGPARGPGPAEAP